jgi:hypothetical protein
MKFGKNKNQGSVGRPDSRNSERIFKMEYNQYNQYEQYVNDPVDEMVEDIKGSADVLAKVLFAGFNIVFLVVLGIILISNLTLH